MNKCTCGNLGHGLCSTWCDSLRLATEKTVIQFADSPLTITGFTGGQPVSRQAAAVGGLSQAYGGGTSAQVGGGATAQPSGVPMYDVSGTSHIQNVTNFTLDNMYAALTLLSPYDYSSVNVRLNSDVRHQELQLLVMAVQ